MWVWNLASDPKRKGDILNEIQKDAEEIIRNSEGGKETDGCIEL